MYYERKQDKYKFKIDNNLKNKGQPIFGESDDKTKIVKINKRLSKYSRKRPIKKGSTKYPELKDTLYHERYHTLHPKASERTTYKKTKKAMKKIGKKASQKLYNLIKKR